MSEQDFAQHLLDQLRQITDRLANIELALEGSAAAAPRTERFWNDEDEPVGVRYEERAGVFKWKSDFKNIDRSYCKLCEHPIYWVRSKQGPGKSDDEPKGASWVAVNPEGFCHFETCKKMDHDSPLSEALLEETKVSKKAATEDVPF